MTRMCTNPSVYEVDAYWRSQGVTDEDQVRHEVLWEFAGRGEVPLHCAECRYCSETFESFQRMQAALKAKDKTTLAVCPDAAALESHHYGDPRNSAIAEHLKTCTACREDLAFISRSQEPRDKVLPLRSRMKWLLAAAAALIFTLLPWPWKKSGTPAVHVYQQSSMYAKLAEVPPIDRTQLMAICPEDHQGRVEKVLALYEKGDYKEAERVADIIVRAVDDPAAGYLLAMAQYKQGKLPQALESMRTSEKTPPLTGYRCWGALQLALMLGDTETIKRELQHVGGEPEYHDRCMKLKEQLKLG